jgi:asparagine synthase (glutamine-hydrolysing)
VELEVRLMCGIFGTIRLDGTANRDEALVRQGSDLLRHRGPDGEGIVQHGVVCFGHRRLAIIDLEAGAQPMWSADDGALITYNGELYNYKALRDELARRGSRFRTNSDTEVLVAAYQQWGEDCLSRLRGMYAFAAYDAQRGQVLLARDRPGEKPLFYTVRNGRLAFSSELEPLFRTFGPFRLNLDAMDEYLAWQYVPAPATIYQDVFCLPPAHRLTIDLRSGKVTQDRYWQLTFREDHSLTEAEWESRIAAKIREAVESRLVSDVAFGAFLSGGVDSSLVVGCMADALREPVRTFSIGYAEQEYSELPFAREVAEICGTQHLETLLGAEALDEMPRLVRHYGQPFADSSMIPTFNVSRLARAQVKMVLSGDGGDEGFGGYNTYEGILSSDGGYADAGRTTVAGLGRKFLGELLGRSAPVAVATPLADLHERYYRHFSLDDRQALYRPEYQAWARDRVESRRAILHSTSTPALSRLQLVDVLTYLPHDVLTKVDIASMAMSLEVRAPLLDHELLEMAATLPVELRLKPTLAGFTKKYLMKQVALRRFPAHVIERPKRGFGLPMGHWLGARRAMLAERLTRSEALATYFSRERMAALVAAHTASADQSARLWNLLVLDEWLITHDGVRP